MEMQVASEANLRAHQGFDVVPWKSDVNSPAHPKSYRVLRSATVGEFTELVAEDLDVQPELCRPWAMVNRQNGTVRPDQPILFPNMAVEEAAVKYGTKTAPFRIWIEQTSETDEEGKPVWGDAQVGLHGQANNRPILLFLKHFDTEAQTLLGVRHFYAAWHDKIVDISPTILKIMGWPAGTPFKLYEVRDHLLRITICKI